MKNLLDLILAVIVNGVIALYVVTIFTSNSFFKKDCDVSVNLANPPSGTYCVDLMVIPSYFETGGFLTNTTRRNDALNGDCPADCDPEMYRALCEQSITGTYNKRKLQFVARLGATGGDPAVNLPSADGMYRFTGTVTRKFYVIVVTEDLQTFISQPLTLTSRRADVKFDVQSGKTRQSPLPLLLKLLTFFVPLTAVTTAAKLVVCWMHEERSRTKSVIFAHIVCFPIPWITWFIAVFFGLPRMVFVLMQTLAPIAKAVCEHVIIRKKHPDTQLSAAISNNILTWISLAMTAIFISALLCIIYNCLYMFAENFFN